jgi:hypothetical protein
MKKMHLPSKLLVVGLTATVLMLTMPIGAQSPDDCSNREETARLEPNVIVSLISWIVAKTKWVVREPPTVCFVKSDQLIEMAYGGEGTPDDSRINALYAPAGHIVYLSEKWNPNDLRDRSYLLHELIHHLQAINNVKTACLAANEQPTYELQLEWLREQGIQDPYKFLDINEFTIALISQCSD